MFDHPSRAGILVGLVLSVGAWQGLAKQDEEPKKDAKPAAAEKAAAAEKPELPKLPGPEPIPEVALGPVLKTYPVRRGQRPGPNETLVDASVLPRDRKGIWVLDFAFKPVRLRSVDIPGKGRKQVHYLFYRVINNTGKDRMFVPQFTIVTDTGQRLEDTPALPQAVATIKAREAAEKQTPLVNGPNAMGVIPASGKKEGIDDAVYGVAIWEGVDPKADAFHIYVRGLSDGYKLESPPGGGEPVRKDKTLRIDFSRPGDERKLNEREILLLDPPYEWIYW